MPLRLRRGDEADQKKEYNNGSAEHMRRVRAFGEGQQQCNRHSTRAKDESASDPYVPDCGSASSTIKAMVRTHSGIQIQADSMDACIVNILPLAGSCAVARYSHQSCPSTLRPALWPIDPANSCTDLSPDPLCDPSSLVPKAACAPLAPGRQGAAQYQGATPPEKQLERNGTSPKRVPDRPR